MNKNFSVLMSVYIKENPKYAEECFQSLLRQTVKASEWVIVEDGLLSDKMYNLLDNYQKKYPALIKRIRIKENRGLGSALRIGVLKCSNELIARMDTDDIARVDRFERQLAEFENDPELDIVGSQIDEFEKSPEYIVARRTVPTKHNDIVRYQKYRDAFNHMTVMFKKSAVLAAGNYQICPLMEDTYLWARMIQAKAKCKNIEESLVFVRIGKEMYKRRGGWDYFLKYREGRRKIYKAGSISRINYLYTLTIQLIVAFLPSSIRGVIYKSVLHKNYKNKIISNNKTVYNLMI